jgi:hypothetical protein
VATSPLDPPERLDINSVAAWAQSQVGKPYRGFDEWPWPVGVLPAITSDGQVERDARGNVLPTVYPSWERAVYAAHHRAGVTGVRRHVYRRDGRWYIDVVEPGRFLFETFTDARDNWATVTDTHSGTKATEKGLGYRDACRRAFRVLMMRLRARGRSEQDAHRDPRH